MRTVLILITLLCLSVVPAAAQQDAANLGSRLLQEAAVKAAVDGLRAAEPQTIEDQIRLCEVEAPPFKEANRAYLYAQLLKEAGLTNVRIDKEGNVLGEKRGTQPRPHLVFSAHLDTVFPEGTPVTVTREGTLLRGPGIGDDCRGLAVVLAVARAMVKGNLQTPGTITFVGTVGEEGLGDLRGVKYLFLKPASPTLSPAARAFPTWRLRRLHRESPASLPRTLCHEPPTAARSPSPVPSRPSVPTPAV
jgi:hypothetical protein